MAAWQLYNHTLDGLWSGEFPATHTFNVMLLDDTAVFDATDTTISEVSNAGALEVFGNGWAEGGEALDNVIIDTANTNGVKFDADDFVEVITAGGLSGYKALVIYDNTHTTKKPLAYLQLDTTLVTAEGEGVGVFFPDDGIIVGAIG